MLSGMLAGKGLAEPLREQGFRVAALFATAGLFLAYGPTFVTCERNSLNYADLAREAQGLNLALLGVCSAAGLAVLVAILHSIGTFRPIGPTGAFRLNPLKELVWAMVPAVIVISLALPSIRPLVAGGNDVVATAAVTDAAYACTVRE